MAKVFICSQCGREATVRLRVASEATTYVTEVDDEMLFCKACAQMRGLNVIPAVFWPRRNGFYGELLLKFAEATN